MVQILLAMQMTLLYPSDINGVITSLKKSFKAAFGWFKNNLLKSNADKCHLLVSSNGNANIRVDEYYVRKSEYEKLLGVIFGTKLRFKNYVMGICSKVTQKIYALARVALYMELSRKRILMNAFFSSQLNYCPLVSMCYNRTNK